MFSTVSKNSSLYTVRYEQRTLFAFVLRTSRSISRLATYLQMSKLDKKYSDLYQERNSFSHTRYIHIYLKADIWRFGQGYKAAWSHV